MNVHVCLAILIYFQVHQRQCVKHVMQRAKLANLLQLDACLVDLLIRDNLFLILVHVYLAMPMLM